MSKSTKPPRLAVPERELSWRFSRASGPGGQSVNTTDSRVELVWSLRESSILDEAQKEQLANRLRNRLVDGVLTIVASRYKSQYRNREDARIRLESLLAHALLPSRPRRPTGPSRAARQRRLDDKSRRSNIKKLRQRPE